MDRRMIVLVFCIIWLLSGCGDIRLIEEIGFIHTVGYDIIPDSKDNDYPEYEVTFTVPIVDPEKTKPVEVMSTKARMSKEARMHLSRQTDRTLVSGQLRTALFGMDLAKHGLYDSTDSILRDPTMGSLMKIVIANGSAKELLYSEFPEHPMIGSYIDFMLEKDQRTNIIPGTTLYIFIRDLLDEGIDPIAPVIKKGKDEIIIDGIGLFKDDKYITKIDPKDALYFFILYHNFETGELMMSLPNEKTGKDELISITSFRSTRKMDVKKVNDAFEVNIDLSLIGAVLEHHGQLDLGDEADQQKLEELAGKYIEHKTKEITDFLIEHNVDSLGIGRLIRNSLPYEEWEALDKDKAYSNLKVNISSEVNIRDFGMYQ